jgi:hypothetical protein
MARGLAYITHHLIFFFCSSGPQEQKKKKKMRSHFILLFFWNAFIFSFFVLERIRFSSFCSWFLNVSGGHSSLSISYFFLQGPSVMRGGAKRVVPRAHEQQFPGVNLSI